ncbi:hypothetical protein RJ641_006669 [Dillenia turbinata]|uniref:Uncharacterized protein n=1 Tax=Dillenia turbinata TaxID=194707 RepID=A0AAN8VI68_9MAGN
MRDGWPRFLILGHPKWVLRMRLNPISLISICMVRLHPECSEKHTEIADSCLNDEGIKRPSMGDIVWALEFAL